MAVEIHSLGLERVCEVTPSRFGDNRGFFSETYNERDYTGIGIVEHFVQDNYSFSKLKGTVRGLHFQIPPFAQAKLVKVLQGSIFDVAVDIRRESPDFGKWVGITLSAKKGNQIFVPGGFAHGFLTLEDDTAVAYKVDNYYSAEHDRSIRYDDPMIAIDWPLPGVDRHLSDKDLNAPVLSELING